MARLRRSSQSSARLAARLLDELADGERTFDIVVVHVRSDEPGTLAYGAELDVAAEQLRAAGSVGELELIDLPYAGIGGR